MTSFGAAWLALRRSQFLAPSAVIALAGIALGRGETAPGFYEWRDRTAAVAAALTLALPLLSGVSAFAGARLRRSAAFALIRSAPDGGVRATLAFLAAAALLAVAAFTAMAVGIFIPWGSPGIPRGNPDWSWLVSSAVALVAATLVGYVVGILLPWWWSAPAACVVSYATGVVILVLGSAVTPTTPILSPLFVASLGPFFRLNDALFEARSAWFGGCALLATAVLLLSVARSRRAASVVAVFGAGLVAIGAIGVLGASTGISLDRPSAALRCAGSHPQLCLNPAYEPERAALRAALLPVERRLDETPFAFDRVELTQRGVGGDSPAGTAALHVDDFTTDWQTRDLSEFVQSMLDSRGPGSACARSGPGEQNGSALVFIGWAVGSREIADSWEGGGAAYDRLNSLPPDAQKAWVTRGASELCAGEAPLSELS
ncbi:hypothetical protein GCM10025867_11380 [Frondihabitans sucicola]|uniref:ABC transporter permease n=1 Tax=Frondihabitans sucicola TaxID=1268041 RepID=A0ABN6XV46_9MICO|nr:hypothetical protein [Frondihabitans sucicola]BDZ48897.1 hypothetical protein GCM10025867_11380 [Frondihabitans sucicola]